VHETIGSDLSLSLDGLTIDSTAGGQYAASVRIVALTS
jgi:hypothetical protein